MRIFVILDWYLPGYRSGGPVRSIANLVEHLGRNYEFFILTRNRDFQDSTPYPNVPLHRWIDVGRGRVFYSESLGFSTIRRCVSETQPDLIYLNSLFAASTLRILWLVNLRLVRQIPVLVAPRGQLSAGALSIKPKKKSLYLQIANWAGFYRSLSWHATSEPERQDICTSIHPTGRVYMVPNLPSADAVAVRRCDKSRGSVSFVFISRVSPKKNLQFALQAFLRLRGAASFDIYGPVDDADYWEKACLPLLGFASDRLCIIYHGAVARSEVPDLLARKHFLVLPTLDENFGHAIVEAMMAGCPPVTSDKTPWRGLAEHGVGWDLSLDTIGRWTEVMQHCVDMDQDEYTRMSNATRPFVLNCLRVDQIEQDTTEMFRQVTSESSLRAASVASKRSSELE
jgi:glycosyltransferase involved in cell wall biosynthesis